jgi:hypothetical protein
MYIYLYIYIEYFHKARLEPKFEHGVLYEVNNVDPNAGVQNKLVKLLADAAFISSKDRRAALHTNMTCVITCICTACNGSHLLWPYMEIS